MSPNWINGFFATRALYAKFGITRQRPAPRGCDSVRAMRWILPLLLTTLLALAVPPARTVAAEFADPLAGLQVRTLSNGLTVLMLEDRTTPVVSFQIWVNAGSGDEARWTGLAHLFEHMMFRGSKHLGPEEHSRLIDERGGRWNAYTSRDVTVYFEDITAEHLPVVIALEAERFRNLIINAESLASEREVVMSERRWRSEDSPEGRATEQLLAQTFTAHPYRHPVVGWMSDLEQMTVEACREFFDTYYAANNLVVAVAGDINADATFALLQKHFGALHRAATLPRNPQQEPRQLGPRSATIEFDVAGPLLMLAWHAPPTGHADAEALDVLSLMLSKGRSSRLYRRLVYEDALALSARASYWEFQRAGIFNARVQVRPGASLERAEALLLKELARVRDTVPAEAEVARARRALEVLLLAGQGSAHALAARMGREWTSFGRVRPLEERLAKVRSVTPAMVQRVAQKYLRPEGRNTVRMLPRKPSGGAQTPPVTP